MKIENVNEPMWQITVNKKERQALEDIFGNLADVHLINIMGNDNLSEFVLNFYKLLAYQE